MVKLVLLPKPEPLIETLVPGGPLVGVTSKVPVTASTGLGLNETNPSNGNNKNAANKAAGQGRATRWNKQLQNTKEAHQQL